MTQISFDKKKNVIEIENYSSEPVRLNNLKLEPKNVVRHPAILIALLAAVPTAARTLHLQP
jgi:hypothetical protein